MGQEGYPQPEKESTREEVRQLLDQQIDFYREEINLLESEMHSLFDSRGGMDKLFENNPEIEEFYNEVIEGLATYMTTMSEFRSFLIERSEVDLDYVKASLSVTTVQISYITIIERAISEIKKTPTVQ